MSDAVLLQSVEGGVRTLTMNRPDKRNALSPALVDALIDGLGTAASCAETRVVVLTGAGDKAFCSGADLDPMAAAAGPIAMHDGRRRFVELLRAFRRSPKPIIARINGPVAAGGMGLVASCDMAIAADDAHFATPEVKVGLFPMMIMAVLARSVAQKPLLHMMMTGERVDAAAAVSMNLINAAVPRADLDARVATLAAQVASASPLVLRLGRQAYYTMDDMTVDAALEYLCNQLTVNTLAEDAAEGLMAFLGRRAPSWQGR